ncbi:hypothetical protein KIW84_044996 [Lathyrus oleraceus]|uniref:Uncharacterized protein n=1 Tax=Pisum sativum TaxID=3888 RepID=A0A9D4XHE9_PEA|nr:hypothetical protein KIW84_044996 [Pisum sativum]
MLTMMLVSQRGNEVKLNKGKLRFIALKSLRVPIGISWLSISFRSGIENMYRKSQHTRESDLKYYQRRYFNELKDDYYKLEIYDSIIRCPFYLNKDYYFVSDLLRHASRIAGDLHGDTVKEIAKHSALERYLDFKISDDKSHVRNVDTDKLFHVNSAKDKLPRVNVADDKSLNVVNTYSGLFELVLVFCFTIFREISNMRNAERNYVENVTKDHEKAMLELEARRNELMSREKNLQKRQADNHNERDRLYHEKKNNEIAIAEQQKADNKMMRLAEEHQAQISFSF